MKAKTNPPLGASDADLPSQCLALTEFAPQGVALIEAHTHRVLCVNAAFTRLLQKPVDQLAGKRLGDLLPENDDCKHAIDRVQGSGKPERYIKAQSTEPNPIYWSYALWPVVYSEATEYIMVQITAIEQFPRKAMEISEALMLGTVRQHELTEAANALNEQLTQEIHERKQTEKALLAAQSQMADFSGKLEGKVRARTEELTEASGQLEAFVYTIAHDLRAPLRAMQGFSTLILEEAGTALSETAKGYAQRIQKAALFMDELLCDLLSFSRISQQHIELTPVPLSAVVQSVVARLQKTIEEAKAMVTLAGPWPAVLAHEPTLTQVLFNLVSNALKFTAPDRLPQLVLRTQEQAGFIRIWVQDNGIGIPAEYQTEIFRPFTRLHGTHYEGTGIGLSIVKKGVERMGGRVGVESEAGKGSQFWFELKTANSA